MATMYVAFGSNLGRRRFTVENALRALAAVEGVRLVAVSRLYETSPVGGPAGQRRFLNGVVALETDFPPAKALALLHGVEKRFGRSRRVRWDARTLDLDLLAAGRRTIRSPRLILPHPRYHERRFVLAPFCDVAPDFVHPRLRVTNRTLLRRLTSKERVRIIGTWKKSRFQSSAAKRKTASRSSR